MYQNPILDFITNPFFLISLGFWLVVIILVRLFRNRRGLFEYIIPFLFMARTRRFNRLLARIGQRWPRFWKVFWTIGIFVSFSFMIYGFWFFTTNLIALIVNPKIENAVAPLIPGVTISLPFFMYLIIPMLFVITIHEFGHGVAATAEKIEVKSTGIMAIGAFFIVGFGAFVEPDDRAFRGRRYSRVTKMRIAAAGTYMNAIEAGIAFLLILNFSAIISPMYSQHAFSIQSVLSTADGGFNANTLVPGEVCTAINGTAINLDSSPTLNDVLMNKTSLRCSVGDFLDFTMYQPDTKAIVHRMVVLGPRNFIGFTTQEKNNTAALIDNVYTVAQGGNNYGVAQVNWVITQFNGVSLDYTANQTVEYLLNQVQAGSQVNMTVEGQGEVNVNVNYFPTVDGAYVFNNTYLGFTYSYFNATAVRIDQVFSNATEGGDNEGRINAGTVVTMVNGLAINNSSQTLADILQSKIQPVPGSILNVTTSDGIVLYLNTEAIPVITVYVGLTTADFWIPSNFFSALLSGTFPSWLREEIVLFLLIALSLTIFNMMPLPVFDGNRLVSEALDWFVDKTRGVKRHPEKRTDVRLQYYEKNLEYKFPEAEIIDVERVTYESDPMFVFEKGKDFKLLETGDGSTYDGLSFDIENGKKPVDKEMLHVDYSYIQDDNQGLKKGILWAFWIISLAIIVGNFLVSFLKFGNPLSFLS